MCSVQCAMCSVQCAVCSVQCAVCSRPFQKGALCGNYVGSVELLDHMNIGKNFYEIQFFVKILGSVPPGPPFYPTPPPFNTHQKVVETMPWMFRKAQRSGKLLEAWSLQRF